MIKYKLLIFLLVCIALNSCIDDLESCIDDSDNDIPEVFTDGYALNFKVTLDPMGGTRATGDDENPLAELESYIDPEKFRVLFFDREDRFLFESKSRWVKKIVPTGDNYYSEWFVSVPLYDYGNDEAYNWKWKEIRRVLTGEDVNDEDAGYTDETKSGNVAFKIAILANRPGTEWNMGIVGRDADKKNMDDVIITQNGWKLQNGPFWNNEHTRWGDNKKTVFDLHHCQYDPIYDGKNYNVDAGKKQPNQPANDGNGIWNEFPQKGGGWWYQDLNVYGFIAGEVKEGEGFPDDVIGKPAMGATSTWVSWKNNDTDKDPNLNNIRKFVKLTKDHPIPMYGIQAFEAIGEDWVKGTPFNLSHIADGQTENDYNFKSISLLRSVVKLELILPGNIDKSKLRVAMIYPNVYARCEPMNVWTPTDQIWTNDDTHDEDGLDGTCEWYRIRKYGPVSRKNDYANPPADKNGKDVFTGSVKEYEKAMSWFYGAWDEKGWWKLPNINTGVYVHGNNIDYPQIFNSCVQRNGSVSCVDVDYSIDYKYSDGNHHFIVYTGEKNINDPSNISEMGKQGNGSAPIISWWIRYGGWEYGIALAPYEQTSELTDGTDYNKKYKENSISSVYAIKKNENPKSRFAYYESRVQGYPRMDASKNESTSNLTLDDLPLKLMPWPLVRNHVYRIKIGSITRSGEGMTIQTEVLSSKTINFDKPKEEKKETEKNNEGNQTTKKGNRKEIAIPRK